MRSARVIGSVVLAALPSIFADSALAAAAGKSVGSQRGKAAEHMSQQARANTNAQWSADPDRGWVRADERQRVHERNELPEPVKSSNGQQKSKGKSRKY